MEHAFRDLASSPPGPGEILVRPADAAQAGRRDLASLVVSSGLDALARGPGAPRRIVVSADPTLDDMLAATFAERLAGGGALPAGAPAFARYAALQREGLHPGEVPPAESIEGMFLAQRNAYGEDLLAAGVGERFAADWKRTATVLLDAAEKGKDPFKTALFDDSIRGPEFARERAFLAKDREVYRQDVLAGERYVVKLPGGPPEASALILKEPKSLLMKQWARADPDAPVGGTYLLLGVRRGPAQWVFSTDPVQRLPIKPLADALQAAEARTDPARAAADPWFDGKPFGHTLVAAPRGGTVLTEAAVLGALKSWTRARRPRGRHARRRTVALAAFAGAVLAGAVVWRLMPRSEAVPLHAVDFLSRGPVLEKEQTEAILARADGMRGFALLVAVGLGKGVPLPAPALDTAKVYRMLRDRYGFQPDDMVLMVDEPERALDADGKRLPVAPGPPDLAHVSKAIEDLGERVKDAEGAMPSQFVFYYAGHGVVTEPGERVGYLKLAGYSDDRSLAHDLRGYDMGHLASDVRRKVGCTHNLLLIDCCFSGFTVNRVGEPLDEPSSVYALWKRPALVVITAGREEEEVAESEGKSYFTTVLLEALGADPDVGLDADGQAKPRTKPAGATGATHDRIVTDAELGAYLVEKVPARLTRSGVAPYTPLYFRGLEGDDVGQFLFIPRPAR